MKRVGQWLRALPQGAVFPPRVLRLSLALILALVGCADRASNDFPEGVVATVDGVAISAHDFTAELQRRDARAPGRFASAGARRALLEEMVDLEVLATRARREGYQADPEFKAWVQRALASRYREAQLASRLSRISATEEEIRSYYHEHAEEYATPERVRSAVIVVRVPARATPQRRGALLERARSALSEARSLPADVLTFGALAVRHSDDQATRYKGGDTGSLRREEHDARFPPALVEAVFALEDPGELSEIVTGPDGFYLAKLIERKPAAIRPLDELRESIRFHVIRANRDQIMRAFERELRKEMRVEINEALFESIKPRQERPTEAERRIGPPAMGNG